MPLYTEMVTFMVCEIHLRITDTYFDIYIHTQRERYVDTYLPKTL